jgi:ABC-type antimicrobial peptide transport system permease subunit
MALGASPGAVMRMVLGHGRRLTLLGIAIGIAGAYFVSKLMRQTLFEVDPADPLIYLSVAVMLLLAVAAVGVRSSPRPPRRRPTSLARFPRRRGW